MGHNNYDTTKLVYSIFGRIQRSSYEKNYFLNKSTYIFLSKLCPRFDY